MADDIPHSVAVHQNVGDEAFAFPECEDVKVVGEVVQVDLRLFVRIEGVQSYVSLPREWPYQVHDRGEPVPFRWDWEVPLECVGEHGLLSLNQGDEV